MKTVKIKVEYSGPLDMDIDKKIRSGMEAIGGRWIGQGTDLTTGIRDIGFELEVGD